MYSTRRTCAATRRFFALVKIMSFAFSADGKTALVANHGDGSVSIDHRKWKW
jgi:hypothetical protein